MILHCVCTETTPKYNVLLRPFGSLQVVVSLLKLPNVFVELLLDAARLAKVILEHRNLFVTLGVLLLQLLLKMGQQKEENLGHCNRRHGQGKGLGRFFMIYTAA